MGDFVVCCYCGSVQTLEQPSGQKKRIACISCGACKFRPKKAVMDYTEVREKPWSELRLRYISSSPTLPVLVAPASEDDEGEKSIDVLDTAYDTVTRMSPYFTSGVESYRSSTPYAAYVKGEKKKWWQRKS